MKDESQCREHQILKFNLPVGLGRTPVSGPFLSYNSYCTERKNIYNVSTTLHEKCSVNIYGGLAQLARAVRLHRKGHRFKSCIPHKQKNNRRCGFSFQ